MEFGRSAYFAKRNSNALTFKYLSLQTCRTFHEAGKTDTIWHLKALECYPASTVRIGEHYATYRDLVKDDNAQQTSVIYPLHNVSCDYKHNRTDYFFECCVTGVQWDRSRDTLRLFFDARGEIDLRDPLASSLGVVVHRTFPSRRELRAAIARVIAQRLELRDLVERLEPEIVRDPDIAARHHAARSALNTASARLVQLTHELQHASCAGFSDLLSVIRPTGHRWVTHALGHYKGWLDFGTISQVDALESILPSSWHLKKEVARHGMDIVFSYANPVPVLPQTHMVDYHPAHLLHIPPGGSMHHSIFSCARYAAPEELSTQMLEESEEDERHRWAHVIPEIEAGQRSFDSWFVS